MVTAEARVQGLPLCSLIISGMLMLYLVFQGCHQCSLSGLVENTLNFSKSFGLSAWVKSIGREVDSEACCLFVSTLPPHLNMAAPGKPSASTDIRFQLTSTLGRRSEYPGPGILCCLKGVLLISY